MGAFVCTMCGACCTNFGPDRMVLLLERDVAAIARATGLSVEAARRRFCRVNRPLSRRAGKTVHQLKARDGRCVFLAADQRCAVHEDKPTQCRIGPDRFLPHAMKRDYACMADVEPSDSDDLTARFFVQLMED